MEETPFNVELFYFEVVTVKAVDGDEGDFGHVTYSLAGSFKNAFSIGLEDGTISVLDPAVLDREATDFITLQVTILHFTLS